jgi:hypothetical protein
MSESIKIAVRIRPELPSEQAFDEENALHIPAHSSQVSEGFCDDILLTNNY